MHDQTANQTLVVSCEGEVENVEREGGQEKNQKCTYCSPKSGRMTSAGLFVSCPDFRLTDRKLGGMKKNATMTATTEPRQRKSSSSLTGQWNWRLTCTKIRYPTHIVGQWRQHLRIRDLNWRKKKSALLAKNWPVKITCLRIYMLKRFNSFADRRLWIFFKHTRTLKSWSILFFSLFFPQSDITYNIINIDQFRENIKKAGFPSPDVSI